MSLTFQEKIVSSLEGKSVFNYLDADSSSTTDEYSMDSRFGAGAAVAGFINRVAFSSEGLSIDSVTILGNAANVLSLAPSLAELPVTTQRPAVNIQVSLGDLAGDAYVPDIASLFTALQILGDAYTGAVLLSESVRDALFHVSLARALNAAGHDVIHAYDRLAVGQARSNAPGARPVAAGSFDLEQLLAANVAPFTYVGSPEPRTVIVVPASAHSQDARTALASLLVADVGLVIVHVIAPWSPDAFRAALPASATSVHVFDEGARGYFFDLVLGATLGSGLSVRSVELTAPVGASATDAWVAAITARSTLAIPRAPASAATPAANKLVLFYDRDDNTAFPTNVLQAFETQQGLTYTYEERFDAFSQGGLKEGRLLLVPEVPGTPDEAGADDSGAAVVAPALVFVNSPAVLAAYDPLASTALSPASVIVLSTNWTADELDTKLSPYARAHLAAIAPGQFNLILIDIPAVAKLNGVAPAVIQEIVFWSVYLPKRLSSDGVLDVLLSSTHSFRSWKREALKDVFDSVRNSLTEAEIKAAWAAPPAEDASAPLPTALLPTAPAPNAFRTPPAETPAPHISVAHRLMFPEAFETAHATRPDLTDRTFIVEVSSFKRLTPLDYDRNVFHIEFDTRGTGLKYAVGEALGVHGWNDEEEVASFIADFGINPDAVVDIPAPTEADPSAVQTRTAFQALQQNVDLFGKPPKSFFAALSAYATDEDQARALRFIGSSEGNSTFRKLSDLENVTYADILRRYPSAKLSLAQLVAEVEPIAPRHYSIASSQNFVGDSVHLLVVAVEWKDSLGRTRMGQCTRYLAGLSRGTRVTVSVRPSVMKLPPIDSAPVIMAGLGTGAAPFRAFIQEREYRRALGQTVGPLLYYFGARYRSTEFLYGEEIEAYLKDGLVTHAGLAFSRDTRQKVYIQHKMMDDSELLANMLTGDNGAFYLCGPTWPVPDVYDALIKALSVKGYNTDQAAAYIEKLKEEERYVLEVY